MFDLKKETQFFIMVNWKKCKPKEVNVLWHTGQMLRHDDGADYMSVIELAAGLILDDLTMWTYSSEYNEFFVSKILWNIFG